MDDRTDIRDDAEKLAWEIYYVFKELEIIIPELSNYPMGGKDLKWFRLADVTDEKRTIRDYILYCYAENQLEVSSVEDIRCISSNLI